MQNERVRFSRPVLMLVTDRLRIADRPRGGSEELDDIAREASLGGVDIVQLREKDVSTPDLIRIGLHVRDAIGGRARLFVNADLAAAGTLAANGAHLPTGGPTVEAREMLGERIVVSVAAHNVEEARRAERDGADMLVAGTVFSSASHPGGELLGLDGLRSICAAVDIPVLGIGGVTADNAASVMQTGAAGVAVIGAIFDAPDPRSAARDLRRAIDNART
jgi:thiamine-phosphate pyrophosphorylase